MTEHPRTSNNSERQRRCVMETKSEDEFEERLRGRRHEFLFCDCLKEKHTKQLFISSKDVFDSMHINTDVL